MFSAVRRAWKRYLESIPELSEPEPVSDNEVLKEMFDPHDPQVVQAFGEVAQCIVDHLDPEIANKTKMTLVRRLRPDTSPAEALCSWIAKKSGPQSLNIGLLAIDWKAREEIDWQIQRIAKAHGIELGWHYEWRSDEIYRDQDSSDRFPVEAPLHRAAEHFEQQGLSLVLILEDDAVFGFAVAKSQENRLHELCESLSICRSKV